MRAIKVVAKYSWRTFLVSLLLGMTAALSGAAVFMHGVSQAEIPQAPNALEQEGAITIFAQDGVTQIAQLQPENGVRTIVSSDQISDHMKNALVAAEDKTFWENHGVSIQGTAAAAYRHARNIPGAGGGSTITQQLVKNTLVGDEYSLTRKWKEALSAVKLTAAWEKDDIITSYLNTIYFGRGSLGIEEAAKAYFGIHASELNLSQSALIAGIIQAPSQWDPLVNQEGAEYRFEYVKEQMLKNGFITAEEHASMEFPEVKTEYTNNQSTGLADTNGHIVSLVLQELERQGVSREDLHLMGATIITTIDPRINNAVIEKARGAAQFNNTRVAVAAVDPSTGAIRGMYGGDDGQGYDLASNPQMTGSTFKVFALAAALENGIGLDTPIDSSPYQYNGVTVQNSGGASCGNCSLAEATKQSLNTSFYRVQDMLPQAENTTREFAQKMGVDAPLSEKDGSVNKALVLGTYGTSPLQLASGYATVANNGVRNDRHIVDRVVTRSGQEFYKVNTHAVRVISAKTANDIKTALAPIAAYSNGNQLAGKMGYLKTGTVALGDFDNRDALSAGFTDNLAIAVWFGSKVDGQPVFNADGSDMWGAQAPARLWRDILQEVG